MASRRGSSSSSSARGFRRDSIIMNDVGNQTGPRQFEWLHLRTSGASAGLSAWCQETAAGFTERWFEGGHFSLHPHRDVVVQRLSALARSAVLERSD
ncbi:MAG TPA: hypothetical protein DFR83_21435 [Deltaproteobacteria bacterium]|nr:hypothetical protein [Deltaproteobacteria bacterium]